MYCIKCGSEIPDDAKFCPFCAELIDRSTSPQIQPTSQAQPTPTPYQGPTHIPLKSSSSTGAKIAVVLVVIIIGIVLIYAGFQTMFRVPTTGITMLIIGIIILCIVCTVSSSGSRRGGYSGGGCDCSG
ncbi:MAG: zinc ribbon domain-containing protein, partial [Candidatus Lokiarchaeota archaeon]|nr:zinc ribbon domain-containing protein [Candidatus Lokiarchaeota archaeon]